MEQYEQPDIPVIRVRKVFERQQFNGPDSKFYWWNCEITDTVCFVTQTSRSEFVIRPATTITGKSQHVNVVVDAINTEQFHPTILMQMPVACRSIILPI
jgi:hypothetical protein